MDKWARHVAHNICINNYCLRYFYTSDFLFYDIKENFQNLFYCKIMIFLWRFIKFLLPRKYWISFVLKSLIDYTMTISTPNWLTINSNSLSWNCFTKFLNSFTNNAAVVEIPKLIFLLFASNNNNAMTWENVLFIRKYLTTSTYSSNHADDEYLNFNNNRFLKCSLLPRFSMSKKTFPIKFLSFLLPAISTLNSSS